ncbi:MAG: RagB/SusD family nutrient uptake outer membrane protein [Bacteroidales bacterium]|nr:RagB/SusD family nutrient uptake outer membrane protein [Bacteroidales bacterium]
MKNTYIYNKVKVLALAVLLLPMGTACNDFLEVEPQNIIPAEEFWNEEGDVESVIAGCYAEMESYSFLSRALIWGEFRSENVVAYNSNEEIEEDVNLQRILTENITADNAYTTWTTFYNIINRCNILLENAPKVAESDPSYTQSELKAHLAEATAIRSLCYFYLIRAFRDVPYSEEPFIDDDQILDLPATSFETVLQHLITALENVKDDAVTRFPASSNSGYDYNKNRMTKWFIYSLLSELYLWQNDYDNCIYYADLVIERKKYEAKEEDETEDYSAFNNFPLIKTRYSQFFPIYGNAFTEIFVDGNSQESIFELCFTKTGLATSSLCNGPVSAFYGNSDRTPYVKASDYVSKDVTASDRKVYASVYDGRAYENLRFSGSGDPLSINKFTTQSSLQLGDPSSTNYFYNTTDAGSAFSWGLPTWGRQYNTSGSTAYASYNKSNFIIYRLTDIMLLKAEALSQKMSGAETLTATDSTYWTEAFTLVNAVNKRSLYVTTYRDTLVQTNFASKELMTNLVYDERERELMFEGKRFFDLVRRSRREGNTDYLRSKVPNKSASSATIIQNSFAKMDRIYWPYNLDEMKANKNLVQNPAFGSGENSSYDKTAK